MRGALIQGQPLGGRITRHAADNRTPKIQARPQIGLPDAVGAGDHGQPRANLEPDAVADRQELLGLNLAQQHQIRLPISGHSGLAMNSGQQIY